MEEPGRSPTVRKGQWTEETDVYCYRDPASPDAVERAGVMVFHTLATDHVSCVYCMDRPCRHSRAVRAAIDR